jgi:hypothetical protein
MSESVIYKEKYEHNEAFVAYLQNSSEFPDWEIIGVFYSALHYMNLFLSKRYNVKIEDISNHKKRNEYISHNCNQKIAVTYKTLYDLSREARYQFTNVSNKTTFAKNKYKELKTLCQNAMSAALL